jgi:hypothetical protein
MRAVLLGLLVFVVPGLLAVAALRPEREVRAWVHSPRVEHPKVVPEPRWDVPAAESLALLREVTVSEARLAGPALSACEAQAGRAAEPNVTFRRCALTPLARVEGFARANSRMLSNLASSAQDGCRERMMNLGGLTSTLGHTAGQTLRGALSLTWDEVLAGSRTIRAFARDASRLARERGWESSCRALPERDRATADEPVA